MDRVDRWLNAQRGWRRLLIGWLYFAPALLDGGLWWSAWGNMDGHATVPTGSVLVHVAAAALAGIPLAALLAGRHRWRRKRRPWDPGFSWRMIAATYILMSGMGALAYGNTRTLAWQQHQHDLLSMAGFLALAGYGVMVIWHLRYGEKLRRKAEADAQAAAD